MATKKGTGGLPPYKKQGQSVGEHPLKADTYLARDGSGAIKGTSVARHHSTMPTSDSGTIGAPTTALKTTSGYQDNRLTTLGRTYLRTKKNK